MLIDFLGGSNCLLLSRSVPFFKVYSAVSTSKAKVLVEFKSKVSMENTKIEN